MLGLGYPGIGTSWDWDILGLGLGYAVIGIGRCWDRDRDMLGLEL
jgi:hypothetical protein